MLGPLEEVQKEANERLSPERQELLLTVHRNGLRLLKLVNTLLDFSRIEAGRVQASYQPTDLPTFTSEIASAFDSAMKIAGLRFLVECLPIADPVYVDRDMWEKIVLNLLSNAYKFTFAGEITLTLKPVYGAVELEVRDVAEKLCLRTIHFRQRVRPLALLLIGAGAGQPDRDLFSNPIHELAVRIVKGPDRDGFPRRGILGPRRILPAGLAPRMLPWDGPASWAPARPRRGPQV